MGKTKLFSQTSKVKAEGQAMEIYFKNVFIHTPGNCTVSTWL